MTYSKNIIVYVWSVAFMALVGLFILPATEANAEDMMDMNKAKERGVYVGYNFAYSDVDTDVGSSNGEGETLLIGYRFNDMVRLEYSRETVDYDDVTNSLNADRTTIEGEFNFLSLIYQAHSGNWQPYVRLALGSSDIDLVHYTNNTRTGTRYYSDSGYVVGVGVDYAVANSLSLRADFTSYSEDQNVFNIGPIYHF